MTGEEEELDSPCRDCGTNTTPTVDGEPVAGQWEWYMVTNEVWDAAGGLNNARDGWFLCLGCLERRLGRRLHAQDFSTAPVNILVEAVDTDRLQAAKVRRPPLQDRGYELVFVDVPPSLS